MHMLLFPQPDYNVIQTFGADIIIGWTGCRSEWAMQTGKPPQSLQSMQLFT